MNFLISVQPNGEQDNLSVFAIFKQSEREDNGELIALRLLLD